MFRVGQKVVCVDAKLHHRIARILRWIFRLPWPIVEGSIYTVERLVTIDSEPGIVLVEVKNVILLDGAFRSSRFRPLVERKADISIFTKMLKPERADA